MPMIAMGSWLVFGMLDSPFLRGGSDLRFIRIYPEFLTGYPDFPFIAIGGDTDPQRADQFSSVGS